ncbi:MAG: hypothetical protein U0Z26_08910 [Anaerolineales bacterium]
MKKTQKNKTTVSQFILQGFLILLTTMLFYACLIYTIMGIVGLIVYLLGGRVSSEGGYWQFVVAAIFLVPSYILKRYIENRKIK